MNRDLFYRLASSNPTFRKALIRKLAGEGDSSDKKKMSPDFMKFWEEVYDNGKKRVPNPNVKTKDKQRDVAASTALKDESFKKKINQEFKKWKQKNKGEKSKGGGKWDDYRKFNSETESLQRGAINWIDSGLRRSYLSKGDVKEAANYLSKLENSINEAKSSLPNLNHQESVKKRIKGLQSTAKVIWKAVNNSGDKIKSQIEDEYHRIG